MVTSRDQQRGKREHKENAKKSGNSKGMNKYNLNQRKVRKAHDTYVDEIVSGDITNNPKILKKKNEKHKAEHNWNCSIEGCKWTS